jgi:hypothetical protein
MQDLQHPHRGSLLVKEVKPRDPSVPGKPTTKPIISRISPLSSQCCAGAGLLQSRVHPHPNPLPRSERERFPSPLWGEGQGEGQCQPTLQQPWCGGQDISDEASSPVELALSGPGRTAQVFSGPRSGGATPARRTGSPDVPELNPGTSGFPAEPISHEQAGINEKSPWKLLSQGLIASRRDGVVVYAQIPFRRPDARTKLSGSSGP